MVYVFSLIVERYLMNLIFQLLQIWGPGYAQQGRWKSTVSVKVQDSMCSSLYKEGPCIHNLL